MKNVTKLLMLLVLVTAWQGLFAQTQIVTENFGTGTTTPSDITIGGTNPTMLTISNANNSPTSAYYTGGVLIGSGGSNLESTDPSSGSETANVVWTPVGGTSNYTTPILLDFGYIENKNTWLGKVGIDYSYDAGAHWTSLVALTAPGTAPFTTQANWDAYRHFATSGQYTLPANDGLGHNVANNSNVEIRWDFSNTSTTTNFRIDDLTLYGTALTPTINITASSLYLLTQKPSTLLEGSYSVSATNLTGNLVITPPAGVGISTTSLAETNSAITLTPTSGTVNPNTIYVTLPVSDATGTFASANITNASTGAATQNVAVTGNVFAAAQAFTQGNIVLMRDLGLTGNATPAVLDEYTTGGSLVQTVPLPFTGNYAFTQSNSSSEGLSQLSVDGQYIVTAGYAAPLGIAGIDATASGTYHRVMARIKYDGTIDTTTCLNDAYSANTRCPASVDGNEFWESGNNGTGNINFYETLGQKSGETVFAPNVQITNSRALNIFDNSIYVIDKNSLIWQFPGVSNATGQTAVSTGITTPGGKGLGLLLFDVNPAIPGPDVMYVADQGAGAYSTANDATMGLFKYYKNAGGTWVAAGHIYAPATGLTGQVSGNDIVMYTVLGTPVGGSPDSVFQFTDKNAALSASYSSIIGANNTVTANNKAFNTTGLATLVATSPAGTSFKGVTFAPVQLASGQTATVNSGAQVQTHYFYATTGALIYQLGITNNSSTTPEYLTGVTFTPNSTTTSYNAADLNAFTLYYSNSSTFDNTAYQIGSVAPTAAGTPFTFKIAQVLAPSSSNNYFYIAANVGNTGSQDIITLNTPGNGNFTFADGATLTGSTYSACGVDTILPAQQVFSSVASLSNFENTTGTASSAQTFVASGTLLIGSETVTLPGGSNFEIKNFYNGTYGSSISIPNSGTVSNDTIYVRVKSSAPAGSVSDVITLGSTGAISVTVPVSGTVVAPFTAGNLAVTRVGTSVGPISGNATQIFVDEYTTSGTLVQSIPLPTIENGNNRICTQSGSASTVGLDNLSLDGQYLLVTGYDAPVGTASVTGTVPTGFAGGTTDRVVARIDYNASINTTTHLTDAYENGTIQSGLIRSAASIDGSSFWVSGRDGNTAPADTTGGIRYITLGASKSKPQCPTQNFDTRDINIFDSQIYNSSSTSPFGGLNTMGVGVNNNAGQTAVNSVSNGTPFGFAAFNRSNTTPGTDCVYIADQSNGIFKYSKNSAGTWTAQGKLTGQANFVTGKIVGNTVVLYIISGARGAAGTTLYTFTDNAAYNAPITGSGSAITAAGTLLATPPAFASYSAVNFVPTQLAGTPSLTISSNGPPAQNIVAGSSSNVLYQLKATASTATAIVTGLTLTTGGIYNVSDFKTTGHGFRLWYSNNSSFDTTAFPIDTTFYVSTGNSITYHIAVPVQVGTPQYFYVTGSLSATALAGDNFKFIATPTANVTIADGGTVTGSAAVAGGLQTIIAVPTVYYSNGSNLDTIGSWGDNTNGTRSYQGSYPPDFKQDGTTYKVANGSTTINSNWKVTGTGSNVEVLTGQSFIIPSANKFTGTVNVDATATLTIQNATVPAMGTLAATSNVNFNGSVAQLVPVANYGNLTINNGSADSLVSTGTINVAGNLSMTSGTLYLKGGLAILSSTSNISESNSNYVIGKVQEARSLSSGVNNTYGGLGIEIDALSGTPGNTTVTREIGGAEGAIGCIGHSILRAFTVAPAGTNTGLNATVVFHYFDSPLELNGFNEADLTLFESINSGSTWSALATTNNVGANTLTSTGVASLSLFSAGTATPAGGSISPTQSIVCSGNTQLLTLGGYKGNIHWESSTDNATWDTILGAHASTYSASALSVPGGNTYYRSYSTYTGCLSVASNTAVVGLSSSTITPTVTNISNNSVTLNWLPVGTGNYNYTYSGTSSGGGLGKTPPYTVSGLSSGGTYSITINQTGVTGCSASGTVSATTLCNAPTLSINSTGNNNINISWSSTGASAYRVFFRPLGVTTTYFSQDVPGATSVNLTKNGTSSLYPGTTYEIYVTSLNCPSASAIGVASNYVYATTTPASSCAAPTITNVQSVCPVQLEVFASSGSTTLFNIFVQRLTPTVYAGNSYSVSGGYLSLAIVPGQTYLVAVRANCSGTYSSMVIWPGNISSKPLCDGLSNYIVSNPTCKGFSASWNADQCVTSTLSYYQIHLRKVGAINWNLYQVGSNPYTTVTWLGGAGTQFDSYVTSVYSCSNVSAVGNASQTQRIALLSAGCRDEDDAQPEEIQPAVQQISADNNEVFSLYPNPNQGQFMVDISSLSTVDQDVRVEVMNMLGQTVATQFATTENGHYNQFVRVPQNVTSGMYLVRVTVGKNVYTSKIDISK